jgi:hypothetical protein
VAIAPSAKYDPTANVVVKYADIVDTSCLSVSSVNCYTVLCFIILFLFLFLRLFDFFLCFHVSVVLCMGVYFMIGHWLFNLTGKEIRN